MLLKVLVFHDSACLGCSNPRIQLVLEDFAAEPEMGVFLDITFSLEEIFLPWFTGIEALHR